MEMHTYIHTYYTYIPTGISYSGHALSHIKPQPLYSNVLFAENWRALRRVCSRAAEHEGRQGTQRVRQ